MIDLWVWSNTNAIQEKTTDPPSHQLIVFQVSVSGPERILATNREMIEAPAETSRSNARINRELT